jgi:hypothetical protein
LPGHVWLKQALDSRKFLHVTWLNIYRREFIAQHRFHFEPGLRHQDIPWTTEVLLAAERVQYTSEQFYDYYIHSESVSHKPDNDDTLMRSARHYMKILEMLDAINQRYPDKVRDISACRWQIAKEGLGIIHTFDSMKDESKSILSLKNFRPRHLAPDLEKRPYVPSTLASWTPLSAHQALSRRGLILNPLVSAKEIALRGLNA